MFMIWLPPFHDAARAGRIEEMEKIFATLSADEQKAIVNKVEPPPVIGGQTPLHYAIEGKHFEAAKWLLEHGANPSFQYKDDSTLLHYVAAKQDFKAVYYLLRVLADNNLEMQVNHAGKGPVDAWIGSFKTSNVHFTPVQKSVVERFFFGGIAVDPEARNKKNMEGMIYAFLLNGVDVKSAVRARYKDSFEALKQNGVDVKAEVLTCYKDSFEALKQTIYSRVIQAEKCIDSSKRRGYSKEMIVNFVLGSQRENEANELDSVCRIYAFLLHGVDVKTTVWADYKDIFEALKQSRVDVKAAVLACYKDASEALKQTICSRVTQAEQYIDDLKSNGYSREVIANCVLGAQQEREAFINEASGLNSVCRYYGVDMPKELKDLILVHNIADYLKSKPNKLLFQPKEGEGQVATSLRL